MAHIDYRTLFELCAKGYSCYAIADKLGCSPGSVSSTLNRFGIRGGPNLVYKMVRKGVYLEDLMGRCKPQPKRTSWTEVFSLPRGCLLSKICMRVESPELLKPISHPAMREVMRELGKRSAAVRKARRACR